MSRYGADSCVSITIELLLGIKKGICNIIKSKHASLHIWQAAMRVKVGLTGRERQSKEEKNKNTWGNHSWQCAGSCCFIFIYFYFFFNTFNMFHCTPCLGAISAYRLPMSSNLNFSINCDHLLPSAFDYLYLPVSFPLCMDCASKMGYL